MSIGPKLHKLIFLIFILVFIPTHSFALISAVEEEDGSPSTFPWKIKFANGNVTDNGDGTVSIADQTGAGGGDAITVNAVAVTDPDFADSIYTDITNSSNTLNWKFNYNAASGDLGLAANEVAFSLNGLTSEGATANTIEGRFVFPDWATADKDITFQDATHTVVGRDTTDTLTNKTLNSADNVIHADTSVALAANGSNCSAGQAAGGVNASGAAEDCTAYQASDATLTAIAAYNTNGLLTQTAADTFAGRTITGTTGDIAVTNGNGVSGNPTLEIDDHTGSIWLGVNAGTCRTDNGCTDSTKAETATNKINYYSASFAADADDFWQTIIKLPSNYNAGTFTGRVIWTGTTEASATVVWGIQGVCLADDDALDTAFGTAVTVSDDVTVTGDYQVTAESSAITFGNTCAAGDTAVVQVYRDPDNASDDATNAAKMIGVLLTYTKTQLSTGD